MNKSLFVSMYLAFHCAGFAQSTVQFFRDEQTIWAIVSGMISLLYLLSAIGTYRDNKYFLWLGIICVTFYTLYVIGAVIWTLFFQSLSLPLLFVAAILILINIYVILQMNKRLN